MVGEVERHVEEHMHGVADELVDHAAMREPDAHDAFEIAVERGDQRFRLGAADHAGKTLDVGEQRGDLAPLAAEFWLILVGDDALDHLRREVALEPRRAAPCARRLAEAPITAAAAAKPASAGADTSNGSNNRAAAAAEIAAANGAASAIAAAA